MLIEQNILEIDKELVKDFIIKSTSKNTIILTFKFNSELIDLSKSDENIQAKIYHFRSYSCDKFSSHELFYTMGIFLYFLGVWFGIYNNMKR